MTLNVASWGRSARRDASRRNRHFEKKKRAVRARLCSRIASQRVYCNSARKDTVAARARGDLRSTAARYVSRSSYSLKNPARIKILALYHNTARHRILQYSCSRGTKVASVRIRTRFLLHRKSREPLLIREIDEWRASNALLLRLE